MNWGPIFFQQDTFEILLLLWKGKNAFAFKGWIPYTTWSLSKTAEVKAWLHQISQTKDKKNLFKLVPYISTLRFCFPVNPLVHDVH